MSARNFKTMDNFDLYVMDNFDLCKLFFDECDDFSQEDLETAYEVLEENISEYIEEFNNNLIFHEISLKSGYYNGVQLYVETREDLDNYNYDNEDCNYLFGMCRSISYRKYKSEKNKINKWLKKYGIMFGFEKIVCCGLFSNGEAVYRKAI